MEKQYDIYQLHIYSYIHLRKAVGWIGILLPFALMVGNALLFNGPIFERSISYYYHTRMGNLLVGALCAVALFMFFYAGYQRVDNLAADVAGVAALGVAWFPTTESGPVDLVGTVHLIAASLFFLALAFFSLVLFRRTTKGVQPTPRKVSRNRVYLVCGIIMLVCLFTILLSMLFRHGEDSGSFLVFAAEAVALMAFGFSWLTKGEAILGDRPSFQKKEASSVE